MLDNSGKILKLIKNNPGIYIREIIKKSKLTNGVVQYHLKKLEKNNQVRSDKRTRYNRYYSTDIPEEEFPIIANIRKKSTQNLLFAIISSKDPTFSDILKKIQKSPSTISWNISRLLKDGIIIKVHNNKKTTYKIKNKHLLKKTLEKEFSKLFKKNLEHSEDIFLAI